MGSDAWADPSASEPVGPPLSYPVAPVSTITASVALTGETLSAPAPRAMTDSSDENVIISLTRSAQDSKSLPTTADVISANEIRRLRVRTAGDVLALLTPFRFHTQGHLASPQKASLRGAPSAQTLVLVDGRPWGGVAFNGSQDLAEISVQQIDRIEIVRSDQSVLYGPNASGGVINIISARASHEGLPTSHVGVEGNSLGGPTYRLDAGSRYGPVDFFFFGNQSRESGFRINQDAKIYTLGGNVGLAMGKAGKLLFDASSYQARAGIPGRLNPDLPVSHYDGNSERIGPTPGARQTTGSDALRASYLLAFSKDAMLSVRAFGSQRHVDYRNLDFPRISERHEFNRGLEAQLNLPRGLLAGGTFLRDRLDNQDHTTPQKNVTAHVENWGWFLQETWSWSRFTLIPGVRFSNNSQFGPSTDPNIKGWVEVSDRLRFSGSAGRAFRAPTLDDVFTPLTFLGDGFSIQGNAALRPERIWTYDAGFELHRDSASVKATYFRAIASDLIQTTGNVADAPVNVDRVRRQGGEIAFNYSRSPRFLNRVTYQYLENHGTPPGFSRPVTLRLSPRHQASYHAQFLLGKKFTMTHIVRYRSSSYENDNRTGSKMSSVATWDARFQYPVRQMDFYLGVDNILGKRFRERGGYPLPGRMVYGGVDLRLWG